MTTKLRFNQFTRTASVMDLRPEITTRRYRCERHARRNKTCGKRAVFVIDGGVK